MDFIDYNYIIMKIIIYEISFTLYRSILCLDRTDRVNHFGKTKLRVSRGKRKLYLNYIEKN